MLFGNQTSNLYYLVRFFPQWFRFSLRALFIVHKAERRAFIRVILLRLKKNIRSLSKKIFRGISFPTSLQIIDSVDCGASCKGCFLRTYHDQKKRIPLPRLALLCKEAASMNISTIYMLGADPFYREDIDTLIKVLGRQRHQLFLLFTDGLKISAENAGSMKRAGNIIPMISVDGMPAATDARKGTNAAETQLSVMHAMRKERMLFGTSTMVSRQNWKEVTTAGYLKFLQEQGVSLAVFLPYGAVDPNDRENVLSGKEYSSLFDITLRLNKQIKNILAFDLLGTEEQFTACPAGTYTFCVYHNGQIGPCFAVPAAHSRASIYTRSLPDIFFNDPFLNSLRREKKRLAARGEKLRCMHYHHAWIDAYRNRYADETDIISEDIFQRYGQR
ncbi:MAG: radical SAM protein [Spirochaetales bacterium]|nr:radical SAM protein [Spirochaetales bacterium]